jgi:hypothetical protein
MKKKLFEHVDGNQFKLLRKRQSLNESTFNTTLYRYYEDPTGGNNDREEEIPVTVEFSYFPPERSSWDSPGYDAEIEVVSVINSQTEQKLDTTKEEDKRLEMEIEKNIASDSNEP